MAINKKTLHRISKIFLPTTTKRINELLKRNQRLVHYTSADNALKIIQNRQLWLRNTRVMDDWSEVDLGKNLLLECFHKNNNSIQNRFCEVLNKCHEGLGEQAVKLFDDLWIHNQQETYIGCLSQHLDSEDSFGRLSMWRAFSRETAGVALVLKPPPRDSALPLKVFLQPVSYYDSTGLEQEISLVLDRIEANQAFLKGVDKAIVSQFSYLTLMLATTTSKHKGFEEEREWRILHSPNQFSSELVGWSTESVRAIPQQVYKLDFINKPELDINNIELPQLLDRVIIGPTQYSTAIQKALINELTKIGVENAGSKVFFSNIPLR